MCSLLRTGKARKQSLDVSRVKPARHLHLQKDKFDDSYLGREVPRLLILIPLNRRDFSTGVSAPHAHEDIHIFQNEHV